MGIKSLLPNLKSITNKRHISEFKGQKCAIDTYCWIHKALYNNAMDFCLGINKNKFLEYCIKRVY